MIDMFRKGRATRKKGSDHHKSKLTEAQVLEIRSKYQWYGENNTRTLAKEYFVTNAQIGNIVRRKLWKHI